MKDEIKEILDYLKNDDYSPVFADESCDDTPYKLFDETEVKLLLDYITNLQEQLHQASLDIQELTEKDIGCPSWCDKLTNLQEENERLKEENKHIFSKVNDDELLISNAMNYAEAQDYKSRCEKAIEYIKNAGCYEEDTKIFCTDIYGDELINLLNILNGGDKE